MPYDLNCVERAIKPQPTNRVHFMCSVSSVIIQWKKKDGTHNDIVAWWKESVSWNRLPCGWLCLHCAWCYLSYYTHQSREKVSYIYFCVYISSC